MTSSFKILCLSALFAFLAFQSGNCVDDIGLFINNFGRPDYACYISLEGHGIQDGSSINNAYAWKNGDGLRGCLAHVNPGDTIFLRASDQGIYELTEPIIWEKSGERNRPITLVGGGISGKGFDFGRTVLESHLSWPIIQGTRDKADDGSGGNSFLKFGKGVGYVHIQNLNLNQFSHVFTAGNREEDFVNHHIHLSDIYVEYAREVVSIYGPNLNSGSYAWSINRIYALGISKRLLRAEGLSDSQLSDIYVDAKSPDGTIFFNDWAIFFHFEGPSKYIALQRIIAHNPGQENGDYDNGDCFATESGTTDIKFSHVRCFDAFDAAFDLKGSGHLVENAIAFRIGNRAFRIWDGPINIHNAIAGFDGQGEYTRGADGSNAAIWAAGTGTIENFTSINNTRPYLLEGGNLQVSKSIIALTREYRNQSVEASFEDEGGTVKEDPNTVVRWVEGISGKDPKFGNSANANWSGDGNDFDSFYYQGTIGFQNSEN